MEKVEPNCAQNFTPEGLVQPFLKVVHLHLINLNVFILYMSNNEYVDIFGSETVDKRNNYNLTEEEEEAANLMIQSKNNENINLKTNENYIEINMVLCDRYGWEKKKIEKKKRSPLNMFKKKKMNMK